MNTFDYLISWFEKKKIGFWTSVLDFQCWTSLCNDLSLIRALWKYILDLLNCAPLYLSFFNFHTFVFESLKSHFLLLLLKATCHLWDILAFACFLSHAHIAFYFSALIVWSRAWVKGMLHWLSVRVERTLGRWNIHSGGPLEPPTATTMLGSAVPLYIYC